LDQEVRKKSVGSGGEEVLHFHQPRIDY
jgi:hypothetical protein